MIKFHLIHQLKTLTIALTGSLIGFLNCPNWVNAQVYFPADPTTPASKPNRTKGTGSSAPCDIAREESYIHALTPLTSKDTKTLEENPTFWFYVPFSGKNIPMKFLLQDDQNQKKELVDLKRNPDLPGLVSYRVSSNLEESKTYKWTFVVYCEDPDADSRSQQFFVKGYIERISKPELSTELQTAGTDLKKAEIYGRYHIWFEFMNFLAESHCRKNQAINQAWKKTMEEIIKLSDLADKTLSCSSLQSTR